MHAQLFLKREYKCLRFFVAATIGLQLSCASTFAKRLPAQADVVIAEDRDRVLLYKSLLNQKGEKSSETCTGFLKLSQESWPLQKIAFLRAQEACGQKEQSDQISESALFSPQDRKDFPWLAPLENEILLQKAEAQSDHKAIALALIQKAKLSTNLDEKSQLLQRAYDAAKSARDNDLLSECQRRLGEVSPRFNKNSQDWFAIGKDWIAARKFADGRQYLRRINQSFSLNDQFRAKIEIRNSFKLENNIDRHLSDSRKLVAWLKKIRLQNPEFQQDYIDGTLYHARAIWTQGQADSARKLLLGLTKEIKDNSLLYEVFWVLGRIEDENRQWKKTLQYYNLALASVPSLNKLKETIRNAKDLKEMIRKVKALKEAIQNAKAWTLRKLNRFEEAAQVYAELAKEISDSARYKYLFWQAKSLQKASKNSEAEAIFRQLQKTDLFGYYGILAHREMRETLQPFRFLNDWTYPNQVNPNDIKVIELLKAVGEKKTLFVYLSQLQRKLPRQDSPAQEQEMNLFFLQNFASAGSYADLFRELGKSEENLRNNFFLNHPQLVFPTDFEDLIEKSAKDFRIPPEIPYAIIRRESTFDPLARSPVDAFGLMQLLPEVAQTQAKKYQLPYQDHSDLFKPEINIPLGVSYLADLWKQQKGQLIMVAALYNAKPKSVYNWVEKRYRGDILEFIEEIPFNETQLYVKIIIRNAILYRRLLAPDSAVQIPEEFFSIQ